MVILGSSLYYGNVRVEVIEFLDGAVDTEEKFDTVEETASVSLLARKVSLADVVAVELVEVLAGDAFVG